MHTAEAVFQLTAHPVTSLGEKDVEKTQWINKKHVCYYKKSAEENLV